MIFVFIGPTKHLDNDKEEVIKKLFSDLYLLEGYY
jgi:hypothetical protein